MVLSEIIPERDNRGNKTSLPTLTDLDQSPVLVYRTSKISKPWVIVKRDCGMLSHR